MNPLRAAYEEVHYPSYPRRASAPDRLAAVATLFGLTPPDLATARVLEIGCSDGGNIIPLALVAPDARFLGVDFAQQAVARGAQRIRELKLTNIELRALDVREFPADAGEFDYIIVHGVFSWVPTDIRAAILALIGRHLAAQGVAFVDYNAQPGSGLRFLFRDAMRFHGERFSGAQQRIDQARSLIKLIVEANPEGSLYRTAAEAVLARLLRTRDAVLFHDDLSEVNEPLYFHDFMASAAAHELQYLAEADLWEMNDAFLPAKTREHLTGLRTLVEREQYLDILRNRSFRQTLLCRAGVKIQRNLDGSTLERLWFSSDAESSPAEESATVRFLTRYASMTTSHQLTQTVIETLRRAHPGRRTAAEICQETQRGDAGADAQVQTEIARILLFGVTSGVVEIHAGPAPYVTEISERPIASPLARHQHERGETLANLDHRPTAIGSESARQVLPLLDGTRTVAEIAAQLGMPAASVLEDLRTLAALALLAPEKQGG
jgi:cyclopropane fatty-acyl-phospholipid synthase-like methyltransferase